MEFALSGQSPLLPVVLVGAFIAASAAVLLRKGAPWKKALQIGIAAIAIGVALFFIYRPKRITVDANGLSSNTYGSVSIPWSSISRAFVVDSLDSSPYRLVRRVGGSSFGGYKAGWFTIADGRKVWVVIEAPGKTLAVEADEMLHLYAPKDFDRFLSEVERYVRVEKGANGGIP
jgi:hypothetical protein